VTADGIGLRVEPINAESVAERDGRLAILAAGVRVDDDLVR
jgi:hypothetical protein